MTMVAVRADASIRIGLGHIKRTLALSQAMRQLGIEVVFVTRDLGVDAAAMIAGEGFEALLLAPPTSPRVTERDPPVHADWAGVSQSQDADETCDALALRRVGWVVVDHYAFDRRWHQRVAARTGARICIIDDIADRALQGELLVDHNLATNHRAKYGDLARAVREILGGPEFALLGPRYATAARYEFREEVHSIGVFMGGADADNLSSLVLRACRELVGFRGPIELATTSRNPHLAEMKELCARFPNTSLTLDSSDLSVFFAAHDLQIGAGGGASWERCCIAAPTVAIAAAINQRQVIQPLAELGAVWPVTDPIDAAAIAREVTTLITEPTHRRRLQQVSRRLVDGRGAQRVAEFLRNHG